jgi:hypothetical protein
VEAHDGRAADAAGEQRLVRCASAIGGAVHGIRTQSEFRRHCQRYERMAGLLRQLDADMSRAGSMEEIREIAADGSTGR